MLFLLSIGFYMGKVEDKQGMKLFNYKLNLCRILKSKYLFGFWVMQYRRYEVIGHECLEYVRRFWAKGISERYAELYRTMIQSEFCH